MEFIDSMEKFWPIYDRSRGAGMLWRSEALMQEYFSPAAALFEKAGFTNKQAINRAKVERWLARFDQIATNIRSVHLEFASNFRDNLHAFRSVIPGLDMANSPVIVVPSLFSFDAHLHPEGSQFPLFFAPDGIVHYHGPTPDLRVLFSHELFHCYQGQVNPVLSLLEPPPIYATLWSEGSATYASEIMNPGAPLLSILLDDETLLKDIPKKVSEIARAMLENIDSADQATSNIFFSTNMKLDWPSRSGYYIGLLCTRHICRSMSLDGLVRLEANSVRSLIISALSDIVQHRI